VQGDGLSVKETGVSGFGFESVAESVAEIEDAAEVASRSSAETTSHFIRNASAMIRSTASAGEPVRRGCDRGESGTDRFAMMPA